MKKFYQVILAITMCVFVAGNIPVLAKHAMDKDRLANVVKSMYDARRERMKSPFETGKAEALSEMMNPSKVRKAPEIDRTLSDMDGFFTLEGPDGSVWYGIGEFGFDEIKHDAWTEKIIREFKYTIYNSKFELVGEVKDKIDYKEDETKAVLYDLAPMITQKFFNIDSNYEVILALGVNTTHYSNRYQSLVYSLGGEKDNEGYDMPLATYDGLVGDAVNASADSWSESFFITFVTEEVDDSLLDGDDFLEYLFSLKNVLKTYKRASYSDGPKLVAEKKIRNVDLPGDQMNSSLFITYAQNGKAYFAYQHYEKNFFVNPVGEDESITEDNNLIVEIYSIDSYGSSMKEEKTIVIPAEQTFGDDRHLCTYYSIGNLGYDRDILKDGDDYKVVVAKQKYYSGNDDATIDSYYIYDGDGNVQSILAEDIVGFVGLSDIAGHESQYMFITTTNVGYMLSFVDVPSGEVAAMFSNVVDNYSLSSYVDRVPSGLSYKYAFKALNPIVEDGNAIEKVVWLDAEGRVIDVDKINLGKNVAITQLYMSQATLSPYFFNTDNEHEYMFLVKRYRTPGAAGTDESLFITAANTFDVVLEVKPDAKKGALSHILPMVDSNNPGLLIIYYNDGKFNADIYNLPFTVFAGGTGTADDPYLIATPGDFNQISKHLAAHYRVVEDIDFSDFELSAIPGSFTGTIDGNGKTFSNLNLTRIPGLFEYLSEGAVVKNLKLANVKVDCSGRSIAGVLAGSALGTKIDNVQITGLNVSANPDDYPNFGGLIGRATNFSTITNSFVNGVINLPESNVGGIVGETRTTVSVKACAFVGTIIGGSEVGGIVGAASSAADSFVDCHVDAALTAKNTVGGIAGSSARALITRCYVEGSIKATGSDSPWYDNGPCAGGIVGALGADYNNSAFPEGDGSSSEKVDPVTYCLVNLTSLEGYTPTLAPQFPNQQSTIHRVIGKSNINYAPEILDYNEEGKPVYGESLPEETAINNNYAVSSLTLGDADANAEHNTVEGKSVNAGELSADWFKANLKFAYGASVDEPWNERSDADPSLYFEVASVMNPVEMSVMEGSDFEVELFLIRAVPFTEEEFINAFSFECTDESVVEMNGKMSYNDGIATIGFSALKPGKATITMFGSKCEVTVLHDPALGVDNVAAATDVIVVADASGITVKNVAEGNRVEVYSLSGVKMFSAVADGSDINVALSGGLYIVKAGEAAVKCLVK